MPFLPIARKIRHNNSRPIGVYQIMGLQSLLPCPNPPNATFHREHAAVSLVRLTKKKKPSQ